MSGMTSSYTAALADLSWLAIGVATLAYYLLGALWFTPLFGRAWDGATGHRRGRGERVGTAYYVVPLVSALLVTVAMGVLLGVGPGRTSDALALGLVVGLGVAVAVSVNNALTPNTPRPFVLGAVTGGYHLVGIVGVTLLLALLSSPR